MRRVTLYVAAVSVCAALGVQNFVFSQPNDFECRGPYYGCFPYTCLRDEDGGNGTCEKDGVIHDFHSLKTLDFGQNGCFTNSETSCTPKANVMICYATYYGLNYCPSDAVVCSGPTRAISCDLP